MLFSAASFRANGEIRTRPADTGDGIPDTGEETPGTGEASERGDAIPETGEETPGTGERMSDTGERIPDTGEASDTGDRRPDTGEETSETGEETSETGVATAAAGATGLLLAGFPVSGFPAPVSALSGFAPVVMSSFSPASPMAQSGAPIGTCAPTATNCLSRMPSKNDSSSIVALSVSTSASMSPDFTLAPSGFSHLTSAPTVMVSLSFGILMIWAMGRRVKHRYQRTNELRREDFFGRSETRAVESIRARSFPDGLMQRCAAGSGDPALHPIASLLREPAGDTEFM